MNIQDKHIVLIGFKHVGKSVIGKILAKKINRAFIDIDKEIEKKFKNKQQKKISCRQIMHEYGESFFRDIEEKTLCSVIQSRPIVMALGGGTPLKKENQLLIQSHVVIHINASKEIVFKRIMAKGLPAFFNSNQEPFEFFNDLWKKREPIYQKLATFSINNNQSLKKVVAQIIQKLKTFDKPSSGEKNELFNH